MTTAKLGNVLNADQKKQFDQEGFLLLSGLFAGEAAMLREHYMKLRTEAPPQFYKAASAEEAAGRHSQAVSADHASPPLRRAVQIVDAASEVIIYWPNLFRNRSLGRPIDAVFQASRSQRPGSAPG